jgi:hypothetical protein
MVTWENSAVFCRQHSPTSQPVCTRPQPMATRTTLLPHSPFGPTCICYLPWAALPRTSSSSCLGQLLPCARLEPLVLGSFLVDPMVLPSSASSPSAQGLQRPLQAGP